MTNEKLEQARAEMHQLAHDFLSRDIAIKQFHFKFRHAVDEHGAAAVAHALHETARRNEFSPIIPEMLLAAGRTQQPEFLGVLRTWFEQGFYDNPAAQGMLAYGPEAAPLLADYAAKQTKDTAKRILAIHTLGRMKYANAKQSAPIAETLANLAATDEKAMVRKNAAEELQQLIGPATPPNTVVNALELLLRKAPTRGEELLVRQVTLRQLFDYAKELAGHKDRQSIDGVYRISEVLARATAKPDELIRSSVATALGELGPYGGKYANTLAFLATNPGGSEDLRRTAAAALAKVAQHSPASFKPKISGTLAEAMQNEEDPLTAASMAEALHKLGEHGQKQLWQLFDHPSEAGRVAASWLGKNHANTPQLIKILHADENPVRQERAAIALGNSPKLATKRVDDALTAAAIDEKKPKKVRKEAARSLSQRGDAFARATFEEIEESEQRK